MNDVATVARMPEVRSDAWKQAKVRPRRLGHATFETPDLDKAVDYYTQVIGLVVASRDKDRAFLASRIGQLIVQLERGGAPACVKLSFEVAPDSDFNELARHLSAEGIQSEQRSDSVPGIAKVLAFKDPKGTTIELFSQWSYLGKHHQVLGVGPLKLGHVAFLVHEPQKIADFYGRVLGFRVSDWIEDFFVFMRCGPDHHSVNFLQGKSQKLHHFAMELKDMAHMQASCELFANRKIPIIWGPLRHGPGHNVATYHRNQDDQVLELFFELDLMKDEDLGYFEPRPWHHDTPQRPKVWPRNATTVWGPPPLPDFLRARD
jgi:catechol 2,3-dioxygenase-like lactoylglutathione lyase family enzyme